mgnify:CR=1 FL=1
MWACQQETVERNSHGPRLVAFRKVCPKLAGDEYPNSADTGVIEPLVCCGSSVGRGTLVALDNPRKSVPTIQFPLQCPDAGVQRLRAMID